MKSQFKIMCGTVALLMAGQVSATVSWTLKAGSVIGNNSPVTANSTAWANTGAGATVNQQVLEKQSAGYLQLYSGGLGINNRDGCTFAANNCDVGDTVNSAPEHAIDNNQRYEMMFLSFSQSVKLTNAEFGWTGTSDYFGNGGDSDYSVMAYTGSGAPVLTGEMWSTLGTDWTPIGNYANAQTGINNAINPSSVFSSYWLIGAYNPLAAGNTAGLDTGNDYLKLHSVTGCVSGTLGCTPPPGQVPEPSSLALFGLGILGLMRLRKHKKA